MWFGCFGVAGLSGYVGYQKLYLERRSNQENFESVWEKERLVSQELWQKMVVLEHKAKNLEIGRQQSRSFSSLLVSNEKLSIFYEVQKIREALFSILTSTSAALSRSVTFSQATDLLHRLDTVENTYCGPLPADAFRDRRLTAAQIVKYFVCYAIYLVCFKWFSTLIPNEDKPIFFHEVGKSILQTLDISATIEVLDQHGGRTKSKKNSDTELLASASVHANQSPCIIMPVQHWIEEAGFWACENNPLLAPAGPSQEVNNVAQHPAFLWHTGASISFSQWWKSLFREEIALRLDSTQGEVYNFLDYPGVVSLAEVSLYEGGTIPVFCRGLTSLCPIPAYAKQQTHSSLKNDALDKSNRKTRYQSLIKGQFAGDKTQEEDSTIFFEPTPENSTVSYFDSFYRNHPHLVPLYGGQLSRRETKASTIDSKAVHHLTYFIGQKCDTRKDYIQETLLLMKRSFAM